MHRPLLLTCLAFLAASMLAQRSTTAQASNLSPQGVPGNTNMMAGNGSNYCTALPNSGGSIAHISWSGSLLLADGTFQLQCSGLPPAPSSFGLFTYGQTQMNVPFGNGYLCIQPLGGIFRMPTQSLAETVTRGIIDSPVQFSQFQPGSTWNFQFWYRDPQAGGSNFNLSDGLSIQFGS